MIRVTVDNGAVQDIAADASRVLADGTLELYKWGHVGKYACPLLKEKVASFSRGAWKAYSYHKDNDAPTSN